MYVVSIMTMHFTSCCYGSALMGSSDGDESAQNDADPAADDSGSAWASVGQHESHVFTQWRGSKSPRRRFGTVSDEYEQRLEREGSA